MKRIVVVGPPCSGKTTAAAAIAERLGMPHIELDSLWWEPNWTEAGPELFQARLRDVVSQARWVLDGNYLAVGGRDLIYPAADTVVWLDQPRWVTVPRGARRTLHRVITRKELWSGNKEPFRYLYQFGSLMWMHFRRHPVYNREVEILMEDASLAHLRWVRLRSPTEVRRWVDSFKTSASP